MYIYGKLSIYGSNGFYSIWGSYFWIDSNFYNDYYNWSGSAVLYNFSNITYDFEFILSFYWFSFDIFYYISYPLI